MTTDNQQPDTGSGKPATEPQLPPHQVERLREIIEAGSYEEYDRLSIVLQRDGWLEHSNELTRECGRNMLVPTEKAKHWLTVTPAAVSPTAGGAIGADYYDPTSVEYDLGMLWTDCLQKGDGAAFNRRVQAIEDAWKEQSQELMVARRKILEIQAIFDRRFEETIDLRSQLVAAHEATAEAVRENGRLKMALGGVINHAREAQDDWAGATRLYAPEWTHPYKDIDDIAQEALTEALTPTDAANTNTESE